MTRLVVLALALALVLCTIAGCTRHYPAPPHYAAYELRVANAP